jgi:hypothetical protein
LYNFPVDLRQTSLWGAFLRDITHLAHSLFLLRLLDLLLVVKLAEKFARRFRARITGRALPVIAVIFSRISSFLARKAPRWRSAKAHHPGDHSRGTRPCIATSRRSPPSPHLAAI